jgi:NADPH:quinone reductase-like Zn-dependent oxidoreductase
MLKPEQVAQVVKTTEDLIKSGELKTEIQARYGYH